MPKENETYLSNPDTLADPSDPWAVAADAKALVSEIAQGHSPETIIHPATATAIGVVAALTAFNRAK